VQIQPQKPNLITGKVSNAQSQPLPNLLVQVYNRDMLSEQLLTENNTATE
jgi:hypothetical protein